MRALKGIAVFYLCAALAMSMFPEGFAAITFDGTKWHVHVVNGFGGRRALVIHCWSAVNNLGPHTLYPGGDYNWFFRVNFVGTTRFTCEFNAGKQHAKFDVFWPENRDLWLRYHCNYKSCIWIARDDGIYLKNVPEERDELIHRWET